LTRPRIRASVVPWFAVRAQTNRASVGKLGGSDPDPIEPAGLRKQLGSGPIGAGGGADVAMPALGEGSYDSKDA